MELSEIANKLGKSIEEVEKTFKEICAEERKLRPGASDEKIKQRALTRLYVRYRSELVSPAVWYRGVFIGATGIIDVVAKQRRVAMEMYQKDPARAIEAGFVDATGAPLDNRKVLANGAPNPNFGMRLPETLPMRQSLVIALAEGASTPSLYIMSFFRNTANLCPPLFKLVKFRALPRPMAPGLLRLSASSVTKFEPLNDSVDILDAIQKYAKPILTPLAELNNIHKTKGPSYVITEGEVLSIAEGPNVKVINLWDVGMPDFDETGRPNRGITVFCREPVDTYIDFGTESRIIVAGRTINAKRPDGTLAGAGIAAMGVYAIPEFKTPAVTPVTHEIPAEEEVEEVVEEEPGLW